MTANRNLHHDALQYPQTCLAVPPQLLTLQTLLSQAYAVLSDPDTRMTYNRQLEQALADEDDSFTGATLLGITDRVRFKTLLTIAVVTAHFD